MIASWAKRAGLWLSVMALVLAGGISPRAAEPVTTPIDLAHARIEGGQAEFDPVYASMSLRQCRESRYRDHRKISAKGGPLHHGGGDAHARERSGTAAEGKGVEGR